MLASIKGHLIGKSEVRHAQGGFVLTFQTQSALGSQEIKAWIPEAEGDKFPFGEGVEQKEYRILFTDLDDDAGEALQAHIEELETSVATAEQAKEAAEIENAALADQLTEKKTELENLTEELETAKSDCLAAKESEVNLRGQVEDLQAEVAALKQAASAPATTPAPEVADVMGAGNAAGAASSAASSNSSEGQSA